MGFGNLIVHQKIEDMSPAAHMPNGAVWVSKKRGMQDANASIRFRDVESA